MVHSTKLMVVGLCLGLSACGDSLGEQAAFGGAAGVGTAAVVGGSILTGAAVGAAANVIYCQEFSSSC